MPAEWSFDHNMRAIMFSHWYTAAQAGGKPVFDRGSGPAQTAPAADPPKNSKPPTF